MFSRGECCNAVKILLVQNVPTLITMDVSICCAVCVNMIISFVHS